MPAEMRRQRKNATTRSVSLRMDLACEDSLHGRSAGQATSASWFAFSETEAHEREGICFALYPLATGIQVSNKNTN